MLPIKLFSQKVVARPFQLHIRSVFLFEEFMTENKDTRPRNILERVEKDLDLPYHLIRARDWDGMVQVLCDLTFLEEKIAAGTGGYPDPRPWAAIF